MMLLRILHIMNWLKMLIYWFKTRKSLKKDWRCDKKTPDTSKFIMSQYFNILRKINFNARMAEALKKLATKKQVENALDLGNKNAEKNLKTSNVWFKLFCW